MKARRFAPLMMATILPGAALAQSAPAPTPQSQTAAQAPTAPAGSANAGGAQTSADRLVTMQKVQQDLQNAGFRDVKIVSEAFVVQTTTRDGNPVVMTMGPHSFSAIEAMNASAPSGNAGGAGSMQAVAVSRVTNMKLYNAKGDVLGDVEHVVPNDLGRSSIVIGHGGFLGLGEKEVAIPLDQVAVQGNHLVTHGLTDDEIKAMPAWKRGQMADLNGSQTVQIRIAS